MRLRPVRGPHGPVADAASDTEPESRHALRAWAHREDPRQKACPLDQALPWQQRRSIIQHFQAAMRRLPESKTGIQMTLPASLRPEPPDLRTRNYRG